MLEEYIEDIELVSFGAIATNPPIMVSRPFEFLDGRKEDWKDTMDFKKIINSLDKSATGEITPSLLAKGVGIETLRPSRNGRDLELPNGWDSRRLSFVLILRTPKTAGYEYTYIQGYTDSYDIDYKDKELSDDTEFFINKVTTVLEMEDDYHNKTYRTMNALEVVNDKHTSKSRYEEDLNTITRGSDVVLDISARKHRANANVVNGSASLDGGGKLASLKEKTGNGLLANVISNFNTALDGNSGDYDINTLLSCNSQLSNVDAKSIPFISSLDHLRHDFRSSRSSAPIAFSYKELRTIVPEVRDDESLIIEADEDAIREDADNSFTNDEASMDYDSDTTVMATDFMNFVLHHLSAFNMKSIGFAIHNYDAMDVDDIVLEILDEPVFFIKGFDRMSKRRNTQAFLAKVKTDFFLPASRFNADDLLLSIFINEDSDGKVVIEGSNFESTQYPVATALSALTSPLRNTKKGFGNMVGAFQEIMENLK